jgi:two-component system, NarL family, nitrate/nitrite response regulator NarL
MDAYSSQPPETDARPRLLIADDDPSVCSMLAVWLEKDFELVGAAADALEAIELAANTLPDGALIDVVMPEGGGPAAVRGILEVSPDTAIVALSADESQAVVVEMLEAGAMSYRRKGEPSGLLIETLHRAIGSCASPAPAGSFGS